MNFIPIEKRAYISENCKRCSWRRLDNLVPFYARDSTVCYLLLLVLVEIKAKQVLPWHSVFLATQSKPQSENTKYIIGTVTVVVVMVMILLIVGVLVFRKRAVINCCAGTCLLPILYHYCLNTLSYFWKTSPVSSF